MRSHEHEKTRANFKTTFTYAHQELRNIDVTVGKLGFHSANAMLSQIVDQLRSEISKEIDCMAHLSNQSPTSPSPPHVNSLVITIEIANSTQQTDRLCQH